MSENIEKRPVAVRRSTSPIKIWGQILLWSGVIVGFLAAFGMPTSIDGTVNLDLQQKQSLTVMTALFMASTGAILTALGAIHITLRRWAVWQGFGQQPVE